eukprot:TRINITY_DN10806_c0_g1_i2.p1 TRINITY_DN10806_c0_g1~~TRINITY_DN10806_c0_g1_i2.p1  ORF type:complete len:197 (+),score=39.04 TRINITY_DN10806_c0_g1_i2:73-591(+)
MATMVAAEGRSELLRGIPDFRKASESRARRCPASVNPVPAGVVRTGAQPRNGHELARELRRHSSPIEKVCWLAGISSESYSRIFSVEMDAELLQTLLLAMDSACADTESQDKALTESGRVLIALSKGCPKALGFAAGFAGSSERKRAEQLLARLEKVKMTSRLPELRYEDAW